MTNVLSPFGAAGAHPGRFFRFRLGALALVLGALAPALRAAELAELWAERLATVVVIEYATETELDRQVTAAFGVVVDRQGTVVLPGPAVNPRATPTQLKDFRVHRPGQPVTQHAPAEYLGQDPFTGWHFVRIAESARSGLRPISDFAGSERGEPALGEEVWGIGLRKKDEDFRPYLLAGRVSLVQSLPQRTAIALDEVAGPGLPVFDRDGTFVGLGMPGFGESFAMFSRMRGGEPIVLVNPDECAAFRLADEVLPYVGRVPQNPMGRPLAWLGLHGVEPLSPEVAEYLNLQSHAALVVSEVLAGSPAEQAGLQPRDILLAVDGEPLPRLKPDTVLPAFLEREVARRQPGDMVRVGYLRDGQQAETVVTLGDAPRTPREAERRFFERLGFTAREFVYADAVERRADPASADGIIAHFVKPSSPAAAAGLKVDDWIEEIDGAPVNDYASAARRLAAIEEDGTRNEFVLLARRGSETAVLRVKLN